VTLSLLALLLAADPCAPIERSAPDAALAQVYARVARGEEARGASATAWRMAAQLEPEGGAAQKELERLCAGESAFERGQARFNDHDCRGALPLLRQARGGPEDGPAALLEGICAWELNDDAGAIEALNVARSDPQLAPTAELFLGLLALRQGDNRSALARLRTAAGSQSEALRSTAAQLLRLADRKERLVFDAAAEAGYDSNASLSPFVTVLPGGADDAFAAATASVTFRPWADDGPYLLVGGGYRKQVRFPESDVGLAAGTLGWELALGRVRASLDYGLDFVSLGATPWMLRQRGTARALVPAGPAVLSAEYVLAHEALWAESVKADSGLRHLGRVAASFRLSNHLLEVSALVTRALGATADRSFTEGGGALRWVVRPLARLDFEAAIGARWRTFDAVDPDLLVRREELQLDALLGADWELNQSLTLFVALEGRRLLSSVGALTYTRLAASAGLRFSLGVW
jgi:hypothetical protein